MWSICSKLQLILVPPWKHKTKLSPLSAFVLHNSESNRVKKFALRRRIDASLKDESTSSSPDQSQLGYDPSQELFGLDVDITPRDSKSDAPEPKPWFGPNGQYIRELPCPGCRGRGYTPCTECGIERPRQDCSLCSGKGIMTCQRCLGECVIWEESIDEKPWEKARSISPLKLKEDDEVDKLELKLDVKKKSKRVYQSPPPEVGKKISRSLKSLNAKTGLFSKRMKIIHRDPALHAQRVAAIKKAKGTDAARKHASETLKTFFSDPENRHKRSMAMKGVKFFCKNCGREGHRRHYCPERVENVDRRFKCGLCGELGHNRRTCQKPKTSKPKQRILRPYLCRVCGQVGHNSRTCSRKTQENSTGDLILTRNEGFLEDSIGYERKPYRCTVCGQGGHNSRTCAQRSKGQLEVSRRRVRLFYRCRCCGVNGHNQRTCAQRKLIEASSDGIVKIKRGE